MAKKKANVKFTPAHARLIVECFELDATFEDEEESELLKENNPELYAAQLALVEYSKE